MSNKHFGEQSIEEEDLMAKNTLWHKGLWHKSFLEIF